MTGPEVPAAGGLCAVDLSKRYGITQALRGLTITARRGAVLGIAGPNGAGKSTFVRVVAGEERPDAGTLLWYDLGGSPARSAFRTAVVHQEPQLFPTRSVVDNLLIGREGKGVARPSAGDREWSVLEQLGIADHGRTPVERCSLVVRQLTEIARALVDEPDVLLLDEPNSALSPAESHEFFVEVHKLRDRGYPVILVSHRLGELVAHADEVAIVAEGRCRTVLSGAALTEQAIAHELTVDEPQSRSVRRPGRSRGALMNATQWRSPKGAFESLDIVLGKGEILGVFGPEGSGGRELVESLAGIAHAEGELTLDPGRREAGVAYLAGDRRRSLCHNLDVGSNLILRLGRPEIATRFGLLRRRSNRREAAEISKRFQVKTTGPSQPIGALSGGNQQKIAIAAAIRAKPAVLALEEPTRGVDIGSKAEIYALLRRYVEDDAAVLFFTSEITEVFDLADRVLVMEQGTIVHEVSVHGFSDAAQLAAGITTANETVTEA